VITKTVEENILRKSKQKQLLDNLVIQEGNFTTDFFGKLDLRDMLGEDILRGLDVRQPTPAESVSEAVVERDRREMERALAEAEDEEDAEAARIAAGEVEMDNTDFETGDRNRSRVGSGSSTPAPISAVDSPGLEQIDEVATNGKGDEDDEEYDDAEPGSVDEYMLRLVEWDWDYFY
jgi:helicase SWR1